MGSTNLASQVAQLSKQLEVLEKRVIRNDDIEEIRALMHKYGKTF